MNGGDCTINGDCVVYQVPMIPFKDIVLSQDDNLIRDGHGTIGKGSTSKVYRGRWKKQVTFLNLINFPR